MEEADRAIAAQEELLRSISAQSERELLEKAIQESLAVHDDEAVYRASQLSLEGVGLSVGLEAPVADTMSLGLSDEEELQLALAQSLSYSVSDAITAPSHTSSALPLSSADVTHASQPQRGLEGGGERDALSDDDAMLQEALRASLGTSPSPYANVADYDFETDEDRELRLAIEASLNDFGR